MGGQASFRSTTGGARLSGIQALAWLGVLAIVVCVALWNARPADDVQRDAAVRDSVVRDSRVRADPGPLDSRVKVPTFERQLGDDGFIGNVGAR